MDQPARRLGKTARALAAGSVAVALALLGGLASPGGEPAPPAPAAEPDRSPVDLVLTPDEQYLLTANQGAHTASLVRVADGRVTAEAAAGERPDAVALTPDGRTVLVSGT